MADWKRLVRLWRLFVHELWMKWTCQFWLIPWISSHHLLCMYLVVGWAEQTFFGVFSMSWWTELKVIPPIMFVDCCCFMCCLRNGATVEWLIWLLYNLVVFLCHDCWTMNLPICVNRLYWISSKIVAYIYLLAGLFNVLRICWNSRSAIQLKLAVFNMDDDRRSLHLHGNTACYHLLVIWFHVLVKWLLFVIFVVWFNMSASGHIVLLVLFHLVVWLVKGDDDKFCERLVTWIYCARVFDVCSWRAFMFSCRGIAKLWPQEN